MVMLKRLRDPQFWFIVLIPTVITYITLAQFFGAGLGVRFNDVLEVVSFLLFVAVPAVLMGVLTVGVVLMGEYGWTRWRERRKAKDPGHQLFLLATEIEQCKCLIRSIKLGMTDEELSEYRETVQEELRVLASRVCSVAASIGCSLFPGGFLFQNHYPRFRGAPAGFFKGCPQGRPSVDSGLGTKRWRTRVWDMVRILRQSA